MTANIQPKLFGLAEEDKLRYHAAIGLTFRPGAPIDRREFFAGRIVQIKDVLDGVTQPGRHVILYGERGVGKTSLALILADVMKEADQHFLNCGTINCDATDDFSSLWRKVFRELEMVVRTQGIAGFIDTETVETFRLLEFLPDAQEIRPDDVRFVLAGCHKQVIIIIDELDRLQNTETTALLADTIKNLSDHATPVTLILIGVADAVDELVKEHRSVERAMVQIRLPRMSRNELSQVIEKGIQRAGMSIEDSASDKIAQLSMGLPHYTHLIALHSAQTAIAHGRVFVTSTDVDEAITIAVDKSQSILSSHHKATVSPQKQNLYEQVLLACALAKTDELGYFSAADVKKPFSVIMGKRYEIPAFVRHLNDFCTEQRGEMLTKSGEPRRYRYRFRNPLSQPFAILHGLSTGLITEDLVLMR